MAGGREFPDGRVAVRYAIEPVAELSPDARAIIAITYLELLLRPGGGSNPMAFVARAAQAGAMPPLDEYVITEATMVSERTGHRTGINIARSSALHWAELVRTLELVGRAAERIVLEITECGPDDSVTRSRLRTICQQARALGCQIALDDAGAGAHAGKGFLHALDHLRPHYVKIDKSLLAQPYRFRKYARTARLAGAVVVAEGVETRSKALDAIECGATCIQGWYVGSLRP